MSNDFESLFHVPLSTINIPIQTHRIMYHTILVFRIRITIIAQVGFQFVCFFAVIFVEARNRQMFFFANTRNELKHFQMKRPLKSHKTINCQTKESTIPNKIKKVKYNDLWFKIKQSLWAASSEFGTYRLCIRTVSPEPPLLAHTSSESRGTFRQKARSPAPLNGWACAVKICHDGMLEDTNSLDAPPLSDVKLRQVSTFSNETIRSNKRCDTKVQRNA